MYARTALAGLLTVAICFQATAQAPSKAAVKKLADELGKATIDGDFARVIDHTYDAVVKQMGGRDKAIAFTKKVIGDMKAKGFAIKKYTVGEPGTIHSVDGKMFVVVPTAMEMEFPQGKIKSNSYLLGISADKGKSWKFVDGSGMKNQAQREKLLPKLPAKLKLPEYQQPMVIRN